jgi:hypothetical protein
VKTALELGACRGFLDRIALLTGASPRNVIFKSFDR